MIDPVVAQTALADFAGTRILVIGDLMLDCYTFGSVSRISPEAPVPVLHVAREETRLGGAANVATNVTALGGTAAVAGLIGDDADGTALCDLLQQRGCGTDAVVLVPGMHTTVKTRIIAERQQVVRVDRESPAFEGDDAELAACVSAMIDQVDGVILEDYGKGVLSQRLVDAVLMQAKVRGIPVGFDPKDNHALSVRGITLATPNYREACMAAGVAEVPIDDPATSPALRATADTLAEKWAPELLMMTLGPHGMYLRMADGATPHVIPTHAREVFDVSGAGDTVIAVALTALASGASPQVAATLANVAAGVVVGKIGTATCTPDEILAAVAAEQ
jgi:rfaE bifunctional protein kinase chain/domain